MMTTNMNKYIVYKFIKKRKCQFFFINMEDHIRLYGVCLFFIIFDPSLFNCSAQNVDFCASDE